MSVCLTEDVTIKPLIICGGCSFTHGPDSWEQVLGNYKRIWMDVAQTNHTNWIKYGREICGANLDHVEPDIYKIWDEGEDITKYAEVMIVGQGAAGNGLNSRVIRKAIEQNAGRKIIVLWQLSGWNRTEYAINRHDTVEYDTIINEEGAKHMYSVVDAKRFRNCAHIDGVEHTMPGPAGWDRRINEDIDGDDHPEWTPSQYMPENRVWLKQGGGSSGWEGSVLYDYLKFDDTNMSTLDHQSVRNLETIEYMKLFCESRDVQLLTFPGWYWCWDGMFRLDTLERTLISKEVLSRIGLDAVDNIDGFGGIAEWGLQDELYQTENSENHNPKIKLEIGYTCTANETSSVYEKAFLDNEEWWAGNHPSAYTHAKFCNTWLKPKVLKMLDNIQ